MIESTSDAAKLDQIFSYLRNIEERVSRIESRLDLDSDFSNSQVKLSSITTETISDRADVLENQIGQFWFAKVGIVLLSIGIVFLLTFPYQNLPPAFPSLVGFVLVAILFWLSRFLRDSFLYLSQYIFGGGLLLLYFTTLRLHFFGVNPAIENSLIEIILLTVVTAIHFFVSLKKQSVYLHSIGVTLGCITALISNNLYSVIVFSVLLSLFLVYQNIKYEWNWLFIYGIALIYLTNLMWFINNPLLGNKVELQNIPLLSVFSILGYAIIFTSGNLLRSGKESESSGLIATTILNCFLCYTLFLLLTLTKHKESIPVMHFIAAAIFLAIAVLYWIKRESKYSTFFFSIAGYSALSVAIIAQFHNPDFFIWLCWQSLLVVSTALWFRSKIIIVANFVMYLLIFISYLFVAGTIGVVTLSFGVVALITARILNWQRNRLDLKTEIMRLSYLGTAFFIFPYALYHIVPKDYVSLSWTVVALIYYVLSVILKNKKYRWMALLTFALSILYILFVGTSNLEPLYRIVSFIVLGLVLLVISIFYGKVKSRNVVEEKGS